MKKRLISLLLTITVLVSLLPMSAAATEKNHETVVREAVTTMIRDYADKVYQANADDQAFSDYFKHGFFGNGKNITLSENSAMTAALFNSKLLQEALIKSISSGVLKAQELRRENFYGSGTTNWHNYQYDYLSVGYLYKEEDYEGAVGNLTSPDSPMDHLCSFTGSGNENDAVQELLSGGVDTAFELKQVQLIERNAVYEITILLSDVFDFSGSYDDVAEKGYNTAKDEALKNFGFLLTFMGLDEFAWSFQTTLRLEVPHDCEHTSHAYRWIYEGSTSTIRSDNIDGYTYNSADQRFTGKNEDGESHYYYKMEKPVILSHSRPWVVEWDQSGLGNVQIGPTTTSYNVLPTIYSWSSYFVWMMFNHQVTLSDGSKLNTGVLLGVRTEKQFNYDDTHKYTGCIENVVNSDGSNMFYYSLYDHDLGEVVYGPEPMDDLWYKLPEETTQTRKERDSKLANGMDVVINYIGNKKVGLSGTDTVLNLRIWENGKNPESNLGVAVQPTCTKQGGKLQQCADCGSEYLTDVKPALGHSYGEYVFNNNATCAEDATQTRTCTLCGEKDSVGVPDTALGHSYGEYCFDNNASCTADGTQTRVCTVCGEKDTVAAPDTAKGHSYDAVVIAPTYTEQGYTTYTCTVCGDSYKDGYTDIKQHIYVPEITAPTCMEQGYTTYTCTECGDSYVDDYTELAEHTVVIDPEVPPTCVEKGKTEGSHCGVCGLVLKKQAAISVSQKHRMEETLVNMPTYDVPGQVAYICKDCGKTDYLEIPPLNKPTSTNPFTDVTEADWFYESVLWAVEKNVTGGKTETTFAPNEGCTRAQVVTFLWAANGKPEPKSMNNPFKDVAKDAWYLKPVLWAVENGITGGIAEGQFGPDHTCSRAQIVTFLYAAQNKPEVSGESTFGDVANDAWYVKPVLWAAQNDVTGGIGDGKFGPNDTCTRAQVVTFLYKVYG